MLIHWLNVSRYTHEQIVLYNELGQHIHTNCVFGGLHVVDIWTFQLRMLWDLQLPVSSARDRERVGVPLFLVGKVRIKARMLSQWEMRHIENYIKLPWLTILPRSGKLWGVLHGEAWRLFIPTAPGSKGAPSSQARALCYVNAVSQISCLLHRQTQALAWELERSRSSTVHLKPSTHSTLTHT